MWPFTRHYSIEASAFPEGAVDYHSHILPGVDDGIRKMEDALAVLEYYGRLGVKELWLTPHIMEDIPNTTDALRKRFVELKAAYRGRVKLHLAAENMLDHLFDERLEADDLLTMDLSPGSPVLLVETSYFNPPLGMKDLLDSIMKKGMRPLLAHPERYVYMEWADYGRLKAKGVLLQLNLASLTGLYGKTAAKTARRLLSEGMYDYYGSDLHRLEPFARAMREKVFTRKEIDALMKLKD